MMQSLLPFGSLMPSAVLPVNFIPPPRLFWEAHGKHGSLQSLLLTPNQTDGMGWILTKNKRTVLPAPSVSTNTGCKNLFGEQAVFLLSRRS
jgi:hypothetical protein